MASLYAVGIHEVFIDRFTIFRSNGAKISILSLRSWVEIGSISRQYLFGARRT